MGRNNKEIHRALQNLSGAEFTRAKTFGRTLEKFNTAYIISIVTFTLGTAESTVVIKNEAGDTVTPETNGTYKLHKETYTVINSKAGHYSKTTELEVTQADITAGTKAVTLAALVKYCVTTFTATDSVSTEPVTGLTVVVYDSDDSVVAKEANGTYKLISGNYTYDISVEGYVPQETIELTVSAEDVTTGTKTVNTVIVAVVED